MSKPATSTVLAWPWGVKYIIDGETFLVTDHIEVSDDVTWLVMCNMSSV